MPEAPAYVISEKLSQAMLDFEDSESNLSFSERLSNLRKALIWNQFEMMKKIMAHGIKISVEEEYIQEQSMKHFNNLEKMHAAEIKANKDLGKSDQEIEDGWMKKIHEMKSSVGSIVRTMKTA